MSEPQKPFSEWTYDELIDWAAWKTASNLIKGVALRTSMFEITCLIRQWKPEKALYDGKEDVK